MTITVTVAAIDAGGAQSGSSSHTVPTGCTFMAALWNFYDGDTSAGITSVTHNGSSLTLRQNVGTGGDGSNGVGVATIDNPTTGSQTLAWNWGAGGTRDEGGRIYLLYFEGSTGVVRHVDTDYSRNVGTSDPASLTLTSVTGGAVYGVGVSYGGTNPDLSASGAQTVVVNNAAYNSENHDVAYRNTVGASTTAFSMTSSNYSSLAVISVEEQSSGGQTITASSIGSGETFGSATVTPGAVSVSPSGIASAEAFGTATIQRGAVNIAIAGITSAEAFGTPTLSTAYSIAPSGIASGEAVGNQTLTPGSVSISPGGVSSGEVFGSAIVSQGGVFVAPTAIASLEAFGSSALAVGDVFILPAGISTGEAFGVAVLSSGAVIVPASIASLEAFGLTGVAPGVVVILPAGIASGEAFGAALVGDVIVVGEASLVSNIVSNLVRDLVS